MRTDGRTDGRTDTYGLGALGRAVAGEVEGVLPGGHGHDGGVDQPQLHDAGVVAPQAGRVKQAYPGGIPPAWSGARGAASAVLYVVQASSLASPGS